MYRGGCGVLYLRLVSVGGLRSTDSRSAHAAGAYLCGRHCADAAEKYVGIWRWVLHRCAVELYEPVCHEFRQGGAGQFVVLVTTGHLHRPDLLVALIAAGGHFLMIAACLVGFLRLRPRGAEWTKFVAGGVIAIGYFVGIIYTTGPQYIGLVRRIFHV